MAKSIKKIAESIVEGLELLEIKRVAQYPGLPQNAPAYKNWRVELVLEHLRKLKDTDR